MQAKPGRYLLTISAQDRASNVSKGFPFAIAQVRYLTLARKRVVVRPGGKFALRVSTDAPRVNWRLHGRSGCPAVGDAALPRAEVDRRLPALRVRGRPCGEDCGGRRMSDVVAQVAGAGGALGLALLIVGTRRELRIAGLAAWAVGCGTLAVYLAPAGHHRVLAAAAVFAAVFGVVGAWIVLRLPWLLALATLACVPARIPVHVGSTEANLLLPLYGVVAVAALALAWELFGEEPRTRELGRLAWPLALFVGWEGLSFLWTKDVRQGAIELLFFILPFGLLAVVLARLVWSRTWVLALYVQLVLMALVFAVIGIVQYESRDIFWNPKVRVDNAYAPSGWFYRVNSVFYDPSIYGRFLVVAILASVVVILRRRGDPLWAVAATLTIVITWAGLLPSFSQSSFLALLAAGDALRGAGLALAEPRPRRSRGRRARLRRASRRRRSATASRASRRRRSRARRAAARRSSRRAARSPCSIR